MRKLIMTLATSLLCATAFADYTQHPDGRAFIEEMAAEGLDRQRVTALLAGAQRKDSILEAIARPAEKTKTWAEYRRIFIQDSRVSQGEQFFAEHTDTLKRAAETYGVPEKMILAIIGVETRYGRNKGSFRVVDALATLGFDYPPRAKFFRGQLAELMRLEGLAHIDAETITGSYAGAMGFPQFIPSSYIHYAVDFDNDGVTDLVNNPVDAIGSVANYFAEHGWQSGAPVAARARVPGDIDRNLIHNKGKPAHTLGQMAKAGIVPVGCDESDFCFPELPAETPVALLELQGAKGTEYWLTTQNFYVITRYNHSNLYAMATFQLSRLFDTGTVAP